jgi:hypothetical protein
MIKITKDNLSKVLSKYIKDSEQLLKAIQDLEMQDQDFLDFLESCDEEKNLSWCCAAELKNGFCTSCGEHAHSIYEEKRLADKSLQSVPKDIMNANT